MFDLIDPLKIKPLTSYLSLLLHRHIIQGSKKYTKKCVMMVKMGEKKKQNFAFCILLKSTPPPVVGVVTHISSVKPGDAGVPSLTIRSAWSSNRCNFHHWNYH